MPELLLQRTDDALTIRLGEHSASVPWAAIAPDATTSQRIYDDAIAYGKDLFEKTFPAGPLREALTGLPTNERLVLVIDDPSLAALPWEYLRDPEGTREGRLLAGRLNLVRSVPGARQNADLDFTLPLHIVAVPVSPVDDSRVLDTEGEWQRVVTAVSQQGKALTLTRVRPPTIDRLERALNSERTTLVHFMGHSDSRDGKGLLVFEEAHGRSYLVEAADFADSLVATNIFLVVLNSCRSAVAWDWTAFGNIARGLVREGVPYALGMQFVLLDDAALAMSQAFYDFLLQGRGVEEAVRRTRRALEHNTNLHNTPWLAGIPVLYTSLREQPAAPLKLQTGQPAIQPDPERLQKTCDLTALPRATHFVGRGKEISAVLDALLAYRPASFVVLHGLGGIGKTSVARAAAERIGWHYDDRVLAISFETLARLDASDQRVVDDTFADRFYNRLARFYELDPAQYATTVELQQAILQRRAHVRSLLVFDNIETLIDTQKDHPAARSLATFISRLKEGNGAILLTSRMLPPSDWGESQVIELPGLEDSAGADLFLTLLPTDRAHLAPRPERVALSRRVQGHPLSIRLLAGRFAETTGDLATFLKQSETELEVAEQATPTSLEDPERQRTLYACMDYSIRRLTPEQRAALDAVSLFQAPFRPDFAAYVLDDEEKTPVHLQNLVRLGLLTATLKTFKEGELLLLDLHPMLRWYIEHHLSERDAALQERYGEVYENLARQARQFEGGYDQSSRMRYLVRQSLPDCEAALQYLPPVGRSSLAYHLAKPYERLGQNRRALALYEQALEIDQKLGDVRSVAVTQNAMADMFQQQGKPQEAMALYEQALRTTQEFGDIRAVAVMQASMADVLQRQGKLQEALALYRQAIRTKQELGDRREAAAMQSAMANVLREQGKPQEALALYEQALRTKQEFGDIRSVGVTQHAMAGLLLQVGKPQEAIALYEESLRTDQELGDIRGVAVTQSAMANVLREQGKPQEALALYEQALQTTQELGDIHKVAVTQNAMAGLLVELGKPQEALALYEQALRTAQELGDLQGVAVTQANFSQLLFRQGEHRRALLMAWDAYTSLAQHGYSYDAQVMQRLLISIKGRTLGPEEFDKLWQQVISEPQPEWLRDVQASMSREQGQISQEQLEVIVSNTITVMTTVPEKRDEWRDTISDALKQAQNRKQMQNAEFFTAILAILAGQSPSLPGDHPYAGAINSIQAGIAAGGGSESVETSIAVSDELMQAVRDFVNADDWDASRQVLEAQHALLFQPEVETLFEQSITQARSAGEERTVGMLELHLALLRDCKADGIGEAFAKLAASREVDLPFDTELLPRSIAALLGSPQEKMEHMQYLTALANETADADLKALISTIQLALFSKDLSQFGRELTGVYRQAWEAIVTTVEAGGVDPATFDTIINNTLAVLGPVPDRRSEWRSNLVTLRNQSAAAGNRNMAALLEAVIGLLDAGGDPAGLGEGLAEVYAKTWQAIVGQLPG